MTINSSRGLFSPPEKTSHVPTSVTLVHQLLSQCFTLLEASRGIKASLRLPSSVSTQRSLKMRPIWTSLALVLASLWHVQGEFVWSFSCKYKKRISCSLWFPGYTCPPGKSKKTITLGVGESVDFSTQDADSYGKNVKCVVKFKVIHPIYIPSILHHTSSYHIQTTSYFSIPPQN